MDRSAFDEWHNAVSETTDEFCKTFANETAFEGAFAAVVGYGSLPQGVDPYDPRVIEVRRKCQQRFVEPELPFTD
ncbi:MAG: hypothetical protein ACJ783_10075 [Myxococcales bacterium]|jgi:hypothetical protein